MANWFHYRLKILPAFLAVVCILSFTQSKKWGFFGHQEINRLAVFTLPEPLFEFFSTHHDFIMDHAVDPDKRRYAVEGEAPRHYIDIDHYGDHPFDSVPKNWYQAVEKYSEDTLLAYGVVPWQVLRSLKSLQAAFENHDLARILKYAAEIGHYIGDAHVPLHTTENYNGQFTNQHGIHGLWETRLVELYANGFDFMVGKADYIESPSSFIWSAVEHSHLALDSVFLFEKLATEFVGTDKKYQATQRGRTVGQNYSEQFSAYYHDLLSGMVERRMRAAIYAVGSFWFTAWVNAGQPSLPKPQKLVFKKEELDQWDLWDKALKSNQIKGRACEKH